MDDDASVWTQPTGPGRILAVAIPVAVVHAVAVVLFAITSVPQILVVPLSILVGPVAVWGVAVGVAVAALALVGPGWYPAVVFVDVFVCAVLGRALWGLLPRTYRRQPVTAVVAIVPVGLVATVVGAGVAAVFLTLVDAGFVSVLPTLLVDRVVLAAVLGPLVLAVGYRLDLGGEAWVGSIPGVDEGTTDVDEGTTLRRWLATVIGIGLLITTWLVGTAVFSLVRRDAQAMPGLRDALVGAVPGLLAPAVSIATGSHGWVLHAVGAVGALVLVVVVLRVARRPMTARR